MQWMNLRRGLPVAALGIGLAIAQTAPAPSPQQGTMIWQGAPPTSYFGVGFQDVDAERAKALKLQEARGIELTMVQEDSPAAKAGLKSGDIILDYNGQRVEGMESFSRFVRETPPNREVKLRIIRNGQPQSISVITGVRKKPQPGDIVRMEIPQIVIPEPMTPDTPRATMSWRSGMLGIEAEALEGGLAEYFGVKEGVLVRVVGKGTAAEKAGLKCGDVIVKVDDTKVATARQITGAIRTAREKKTFSLTLMREKKEMALSVTLDEPEAPRQPARSVKQ